MDIRIGELSNPHVIKLLQAHHNDMLKHSPVESVHALDVSKLTQPDITFYSLWIDNNLAGVGALKALIQRMAKLNQCAHQATIYAKASLLNCSRILLSKRPCEVIKS